MSLIQEHLLDSGRALHLGQPAPPAPGTHAVRVVRELCLRLHRRPRPSR